MRQRDAGNLSAGHVGVDRIRKQHVPIPWLLRCELDMAGVRNVPQQFYDSQQHHEIECDPTTQSFTCNCSATSCSCASSCLVLCHEHCLSGPDISRERRCLQTSPQQLVATDGKERQRIRISLPGGLGVYRKLEPKFKHCKNA